MDEIEKVAVQLPEFQINPTVKKVAIIVAITAGVITAGVIGYKIAAMIGDGGEDLVEGVEKAAFTAAS